MKHLAKTIVIVSMASLLAMSSTADAKGSRKHKDKQAKVTADKDIPWYEQDLVPAAAPVTPKKAKKATRKTLEKKAVPTLARIGAHQRHQVMQPSGECGAGCDKSARTMSMAKFELVPDGKDTKASRAAARARAIKAAKAAKDRAAKKVATSK